MSNEFLRFQKYGSPGSKHWVALCRDLAGVHVNGVVRRIEIEMPTARSWLRVRRLRVGCNRKIRLAGSHGKAIAFQVWSSRCKSLIQQSGLRERIKVSIRSADNFRLRLRGRYRSQCLNREGFIRRSHRLGIGTQTLG